MKKVKHIFTVAIAAMVLVLPLSAAAVEGDERSKARMETVTSFAEDALRYARYNVPGAKYPHLLLVGWNVDTKKPAEWMWRGDAYYPCNITSQQNFFRTLVGLTNLTGDKKYREAAEEQVHYWFGKDNDMFVDKNGLIYGGEHSFVDVKTGKQLSYNEHELKQVFPYYEFMYEVEPEGLERYMNACWNSHVKDWSSLMMNRHGYYNEYVDSMWDTEYTEPSYHFDNGTNHAFQNAGDDFINFALFIAEKTGNEKYHLWGRRMLQKYIDVQNPQTGLSGAQYGYLTSGDRFNLQFGPEFGEIAMEYNYVDRLKVRTLAGIAPLYLLPYVERTGDKEVMDYLVKAAEGSAKIYNPETNKLQTPMWSDGTTLMGVVRQRSGYGGAAGKKIGTTGQNTHTMVMHGCTQTYLAHESQIIWDFVRDMGDGFGLGDLGTKPGENVNLNMQSTSTDTESVFTLLDLYKATGHKDYLELAERIGENMIAAYNELIQGKSNNAYITVNREDMVALLRIEAAVRGEWDAVDDGIILGASIEFDFDGYGRTTDSAQLWNKKRTPATRVTIDGGDIVVAIDSIRVPKFTDIDGIQAEDSIRSLYSIGAVNGVSETTFAPDRPVTRAELASMIVKLCNFPVREKKFTIYPDIAEDAWYRDAVEVARNNGFIDDNMLKNGNFAPNDYVTMEEMTSVVVKALISVNKDSEYKGYNSIRKLVDGDKVSAWARDYVDIACSYQLIEGFELSPQKKATRAEAAEMLIRLNDMIGKEYEGVSATIFPGEATQKIANFSSSDLNVFDVDKNGRIYPAALGSATLTAEADGRTDTRQVHVINKEDWMIKAVSIDGEDMPNFAPNIKEYTVDLFLGTKEFPIITAQSYSGKNVIIEIPEEFPGKVAMYVEGYDEKYEFDFIAEKIDFKLDDNFDLYEINKTIQQFWSGDILWYSSSAGWSGGVSPIYVVNKPGGNENDKCLKLDYNKGVSLKMMGVFDEKPYTVGPKEKNNIVVLDFDVMTTVPIANLYAGVGNSEVTPFKVHFSEESLVADSGGGVTEIGTYKPGEFNNIKIVINRKALTYDCYFNGVLVLEDAEPLNVGAYDALSRFAFSFVAAEAEAGAKAYIDNVKLYQMPEEYQERILENKEQ